MANLNDIGSKISTAATKTIQKTEELAGTATMQVKLSMLISKRDKTFEKLGKLTYAQLKTGDSHAEEIAAVISQIDTLGAQISKQKAKIEREKTERAAQKAALKAEKCKQKEKPVDPEDCVEEIQQMIDNGK